MPGYDQEIIIPGEYVESIMLPAVEHEAGHVIAAYHMGARILGVAVGFIPERDQQGMFFQAL
jgi:predicted GNAT superfamily acetyltransferase